MSTFKVNYAGLRKPQRQNESPSNNSTSAATSNQQTSRTQLQITPSDSQSNSATKPEGDSALLSLYKGSFQSDNLDYINLLLKNKASSNREKNQKEQSALRKKGHLRTKSTFVESKQDQLQIESPELSEKAKIEPVYKKVEENDKPASMRPDNDDGFATREQEKRIIERSVDGEQDEEEFYDGNDTHRNLNNTPTKNEGKLFDRFFKDDGVVRRSMSMEDLRIDKKSLKKNPNKSTLHNPAEMRYYSIEKSQEGSTHQDSKNSNGSLDFLTNLNNYLDYFQKSENISYRNMKAGQYFRGNNGKSHRSMQKELEASNQELRALKMQVHDLKWKVNDLTSGSKMLTKELKIANARNEENQQLFQKMQAEILHLKQKNRHYKTQCLNLQEAYKRERSESESNLLALRQVLANSINVALEHKSTPFLGNTLITDKTLPMKSLGNNILSTKNKDKVLKSHMKENRLGGASEEKYGSFFDMPSNYKRARDHKETPKKTGSIIFSPKISITGSEEEEGFTYPELNSMGYGGSYEEGSQFQDPYSDTYQEETLKDQQIKFLQDKLAELMINEEVSFNNRQSLHQKSTTKSSRDKQFTNKKKPSIAVTPTSNYYVSRDRQGSLSKLSNLSAKYEARERSGMFRHDYEEPPSLNDGTERSFSMHNNSD